MRWGPAVTMKVLVLGGYGLIGREITRELLRADITVIAVARSADHGRALFPDAEWTGADLAEMTTPEKWMPHVGDAVAVVNASGALQSGGRDNVVAVQRDAICALVAACEHAGVSTFVQISAPGADPAAATEFLKTKGEADRVLRESRLNWVILRPGLVISSTAYGGSSLLRSLAGFPIIQPLVMARARLQTVDVGDVAQAVLRALNDPALARQQFDLVEPCDRSLRSVVLDVRRWLGFASPVRVVELPDWVGYAVAKIADIAGLLGWRSPLRTTALKVLSDNVVGDPEPWKRVTGEAVKALPETLRGLASTRQERQFARAQLVFPLLLFTFAAFWIVSGVIGLVRHEAAVSVVSERLGHSLASVSVYTGSILDLLVGFGLVIHKTFRASCLAAVIVSVGYLAVGTVVTPELWADPLGPFVKVFPAIALALMLAAMAEER